MVAAKNSNTVRKCVLLEVSRILLILFTESFTPDGKPNMGESNIRGFYVNCGFNSGGMMLGGGAGRQLAHWVYRGKPEFDLFNCDIR